MDKETNLGTESKHAFILWKRPISTYIFVYLVWTIKKHEVNYKYHFKDEFVLLFIVMYPDRKLTFVGFKSQFLFLNSPFVSWITSLNFTAYKSQNNNGILCHWFVLLGIYFARDFVQYPLFIWVLTCNISMNSRRQIAVPQTSRRAPFFISTEQFSSPSFH